MVRSASAAALGWVERLSRQAIEGTARAPTPEIVTVRSNPAPMPRRAKGERGAALVVVMFVLIVVLAGGLAAIALTSGELASSRGYRTRTVTDDCAYTALEKIRAMLPNTSFEASIIDGELHGNLSYRAGHYGKSGKIASGTPIASMPAESFDASALMTGENITNRLGTATVALNKPGGLVNGLQVITFTAVCAGPGGGEREVQIVLRVGSAAGG